MKGSTLRSCGKTLLNCIEFAGIHTDPSLRCGGNRLPKLAARSDDRAAQTTGFRAAGAAALIPSFAKEKSGSFIRSFKVIYPGLAAFAQDDSLRRTYGFL